MRGLVCCCCSSGWAESWAGNCAEEISCFGERKSSFIVLITYIINTSQRVLCIVAVVKELSDLSCSWTVLTWVLHLLPASCGSEPRLMLPTPEEKNILAMIYFLIKITQKLVFMLIDIDIGVPVTKGYGLAVMQMSKADVR